MFSAFGNCFVIAPPRKPFSYVLFENDHDACEAKDFWNGKTVDKSASALRIAFAELFDPEAIFKNNSLFIPPLPPLPPLLSLLFTVCFLVINYT